MNTPNYRKFRTNEYIQFFQDVTKICTENDPLVLGIDKQVNALGLINIKVADVFKKARSSELTEKIIYYDHRRDDAIICLRKLADGYTNYFLEEMKIAAHRLLKAIDKYGKRIYKLNYQAETSTLTNLGNDLQNIAELKAAVEQLNLKELVEEMITMNNTFNSIYLQRVKKEAANLSITAGEVVKEGLTAYKTLIEHIMAHSTLTPTDSLTKLINELDTLIDKYNSMVSSRKNIDDTEKQAN